MITIFENLDHWTPPPLSLTKLIESGRFLRGAHIELDGAEPPLSPLVRTPLAGCRGVSRSVAGRRGVSRGVAGCRGVSRGVAGCRGVSRGVAGCRGVRRTFYWGGLLPTLQGHVPQVAYPPGEGHNLPMLKDSS